MRNPAANKSAEEVAAIYQMLTDVPYGLDCKKWTLINGKDALIGKSLVIWK